ncbi:MAG: amidohydrolase family protein [Acidobacteriota bacterium]
MLCDAHVHFFSPGFFDGLGVQLGLPPEGRAAAVVARAGWDDPVSIDALADRWIAELDRHGVARAALIASLPGDEASVTAAVARHPSRLVGFFMLNPLADDAVDRARRALDAGARGICLFPAMQRYPLHDERVGTIFALAAGHPAKPAVFVHCGVLSVGVRRKLGLPSPFDIRFGNPLDLHALALAHPAVPVIVPHFGAGMFREALMLADLCPNVHLDTSSSNGWIRYVPGLALKDVFRAALDVAGPDRLLFGTDSSFFPRGWNKDVYDRQQSALGDALVPPDARAKILGGNFARLFPA